MEGLKAQKNLANAHQTSFNSRKGSPDGCISQANVLSTDVPHKSEARVDVQWHSSLNPSVSISCRTRQEIRTDAGKRLKRRARGAFDVRQPPLSLFRGSDRKQGWLPGPRRDGLGKGNLRKRGSRAGVCL